MKLLKQWYFILFYKGICLRYPVTTVVVHSVGVSGVLCVSLVINEAPFDACSGETKEQGFTAINTTASEMKGF